MPAGHVQVAADGSGKEVDADSIVSTEAGAPTVYRQVVILGDPTTYGNKLSISAAGAMKVDGSAATQPIAAASLPLPAGASTEATLALIKAKTDNLDVALSTRTKPADTQPTDPVDRSARLLGHVTIDNPSIPVTGTFFQTTQPVSGSVGISGEALEALTALRRQTVANLFHPRRGRLTKRRIYA